MNRDKLVELLKATTVPEQQKEAETMLDQVDKLSDLFQLQRIIGFAPELLAVASSDEMEPSVRQAAVIYLKNMIFKFWEPSEDALAFSIHEQDKHAVREAIVGAVVYGAAAVRVQLLSSLTAILRADFPAKWPSVVDEVSRLLQRTDGRCWLGALSVLYALVKIYEYRRAKEKQALFEVMRVLLPVLRERFVLLLPDQSQEAVTLQKMILKIFYGLVQFSLNLDVMSKEDFVGWMELVRQIVARPVPPETLTVDEDERPELIWWKCKKWAIHLMARIFERYGNPGQVQAQYNQFAQYYLQNFSTQAIQTVLGVLDQYRKGEFVSPRVLHQSVSYLQSAVGHAFSWKHIKAYMPNIIREVIFPLSRHSDSDEEMWDDDPREYIKFKYDIFDDLINPASAAMALLSAATKRVGLLDESVRFILHILNDAAADARDRDGALHMLGSISGAMLKKKKYKRELERMLELVVLPLLDSNERFLRARAAWCVQSFSQAPFGQVHVLKQLTEALTRRLLSDAELPVQVEAAIALQMLLADQSRVEAILREQVRPVILAVLKLIHETGNDDLANVMDKLITTYMDDIVPIAVETAQGLAAIFTQLLQTDVSEDLAMTAMAVLNSLETILSVMEDHKEVMVHLESVVLRVIQVVFDQRVMNFYEEVLGLVDSLTTSRISPEMWQVYGVIGEMFRQEGMEYFTDMMPCLHNYITVDTDAFLASADRPQMVFDMCRQVLATDAGDDVQTHAAKLLEVVVLQCRGRVDALLRPITELVLARLTAEVNTSELRTMLLQVVIAGLYYNTSMMLELLCSLQPTDSNQAIIDHFVRQWLADNDCFLGIHDRKLFLVGMMLLLRENSRPAVLAELASSILPSCLLVFRGLQRAYQAQAELNNADDEDSDDDEGGEKDDGLASDEDEIDESTLDFLERLEKNERDDSGNDGSYSEASSDEEDGETDLEVYTTPIDGDASEVDEFLLFQQTLAILERADAGYYATLVGGLSDGQKDELAKLCVVADQRKKLVESKKIEEEGGYRFDVENVPTTFNFGGAIQ